MEIKCTYCKKGKLAGEPHIRFPWFSLTVHRASGNSEVVSWICWDCRQAADTCFRHFQDCEGCQECRDQYEAATS